MRIFSKKNDHSIWVFQANMLDQHKGGWVKEMDIDHVTSPARVNWLVTGYGIIQVLINWSTPTEPLVTIGGNGYRGWQLGVHQSQIGRGEGKQQMTISVNRWRGLLKYRNPPPGSWLLTIQNITDPRVGPSSIRFLHTSHLAGLRLPRATQDTSCVLLRS